MTRPPRPTERDPLAEALAEFSRRFAHSEITIPARSIRQRRRGMIKKRGWLIQYLFGRDERGEFVDYYASHRMTDDDHVRLRESTWEQLPATVTCYSYREEIPGDKERAEAEYFALNRRIAAELEAKGFGRFTMNQVLRTGVDID